MSAELQSFAIVHGRKLTAFPLQAKVGEGAPRIKRGMNGMLRECACVSLHRWLLHLLVQEPLVMQECMPN